MDAAEWNIRESIHLASAQLRNEQRPVDKDETILRAIMKENEEVQEINALPLRMRSPHTE